MTIQLQAATQSMIEWLSHENELGKEPSKIECTGSFELHGMQYYLFKYKKTLFGKWLLGVCGGYENRSDTEHCGHIFSEMQPYDPDTAVEQAAAMVEMIREYWMKQATEYEAAQEQSPQNEEQGEEESSGIFNGFVLLNSHECNLSQIKTNLLQDWDIPCHTDEEGDTSEEDTLVFEADGYTVAVSFIDAPIPDGEAEHYAEGNYLWKEAVEVTRTHVAQIIIAVFTRTGSPLESGVLYTKLAASCLKLPNAIGLYSSGTVFQPEMFLDFADLMKTEELYPILNLVYFGLIGGEAGMNGYTYGLRAFGKDEIEVLDSQASPAELRDFLISISSYVVEQDVTLRDGETIGFTSKQKLPITRSEAVFITGDSLKIKY